jgi:hypothetical protein
MDIQVSNVDYDFAIIHWTPPQTLTDTVRSYDVHYHELHEDEDESHDTSVLGTTSPYILSTLLPDTRYELFVQAVNEHGVGEPSQRIVFKTHRQEIAEELEQVINFLS